MSLRHRQSSTYVRGIDAETAACLALVHHGWTILARRLRTEAGEIDIIAAQPDLLAIIEVKARRTLADAAFALSARQRARLIAAADIALAQHPEWVEDNGACPICDDYDRRFAVLLGLSLAFQRAHGRKRFTP